MSETLFNTVVRSVSWGGAWGPQPSAAPPPRHNRVASKKKEKGKEREKREQGMVQTHSMEQGMKSPCAFCIYPFYPYGEIISKIPIINTNFAAYVFSFILKFRILECFMLLDVIIILHKVQAQI